MGRTRSAQAGRRTFATRRNSCAGQAGRHGGRLMPGSSVPITSLRRRVQTLERLSDDLQKQLNRLRTPPARMHAHRNVFFGHTVAIGGSYPSDPANVFGIVFRTAAFARTAGQQAIVLTDHSATVQDYGWSPCGYLAEGAHVLILRQRNGQYVLCPCSSCSCSTSCSISQSVSQSQSASMSQSLSQSSSQSGSKSGSVSGSQSGSSSGSSSGSISGGWHLCSNSSNGYASANADVTMFGLTNGLFCSDCATYSGTWTLPYDINNANCGSVGDCVWDEYWPYLNSDPCAQNAYICVKVSYDSGTDTSTMTCTTNVCGTYSATTSGKWDLTNFNVTLNQDVTAGACNGPSTITVASA